MAKIDVEMTLFDRIRGQIYAMENEGYSPIELRVGLDMKMLLLKMQTDFSLRTQVGMSNIFGLKLVEDNTVDKNTIQFITKDMIKQEEHMKQEKEKFEVMI